MASTLSYDSDPEHVDASEAEACGDETPVVCDDVEACGDETPVVCDEGVDAPRPTDDGPADDVVGPAAPADAVVVPAAPADDVPAAQTWWGGQHAQ